MKTLLALVIATPAFAGQPSCDVQPTFEWADAKGSVVVMTWDDEFRVPTPSGYDPCWMSDDNTATCTSGAVHMIGDAGRDSMVWDSVALQRKPYSCE